MHLATTLRILSNWQHVYKNRISLLLSSLQTSIISCHLARSSVFTPNITVLYLDTSSVWSLRLYPPTLFERRPGVVRVFEERLQKALLHQPPKQTVSYLNVPCTSGSRHVSDIHLRTQARRGNLAASCLPWVRWYTSCQDSRLKQRYFRPKAKTFLLTLRRFSRN